jgi:hypothetical protein
MNDAECSAGRRQGDIDAGLTCGMISIDAATTLANECAINERGQYCLSALTLFNVNDIGLMNIEGNCSEVLTSGSCSTACRTVLEDFRSRLGCCINMVINNTLTVSSTAASVDYRVWNTCNVPLPAADCGKNPVTVNPPGNVQQCTDEQYFSMKYTHNLCLPERGQPFVDAIVLDSRCSETIFFASAEYATALCSMDESGRLCGLILPLSTSGPLETLNSACATSNVSCTSNCRDGINNAKTLRGCCINAVNSSTTMPQALSYGVWKSCGVESPGFCDSSLSLRGSATTSIMEENHLYILLIAIAGLTINFMGQ